MTELTTAIVDLLGYGCELINAAAGGKAIYRRYKMLARQGENMGFVPLVVYSSKELLEALQENLQEAQAKTCLEHYEKTLPQVDDIDVGALLHARLSLAFAGQDPAALLGDFAEVRTPESEDRLCQSCRNHAREVLILKCPAKQAWELPLLLPMGGFGHCPPPVEQAAVFQFWQQTYDAVPVVAAFDIWEFRVANPPLQLMEAEQLALQQFAFDYDLVLQAHREDGDSIRALASHLAGAKAWYFWWS